MSTPRKNLIETCAAIMGVVESTGLSATQFYLWSVITGRLARKEAADTRSLFVALPDLNSKQLTNRVSSLIQEGYFTALQNGRSKQMGRTLKATDKTKEILNQLKQVTQATCNPSES
jgi:hypothetical protein